MNDWISTASIKPREKVIVETKIDDSKGIRNIESLYFYKNLWWFADGSMYVYYTPTHWREIN